MGKIGILGLGAMGSRMAKRLHDAGHDVVVYNRTAARTQPLREAGLAVAATPRQAVTGRELVISMVRDDVASEAVWLDPDEGALAGLGPGAVAVESSTLTPAWVAKLAAQVRETGAAFVDAPVAGSRPQAEAGKLAYLVGGEADDVVRIRDVLLQMGGVVLHVGATGSGTVLKLGVNALFATQVAALGEILGMTRRAGIADERAVQLLSKMPVTSPALAGVGGLMVAGTFAPMFPIELVEKDMAYVERAAANVGTQMPVAAAVRAVFGRAKARELGENNIHGVMKLYD